MQRTFPLALLAALFTWNPVAQAAPWTICRYDFKTVQILKSEHALQATLLSVKGPIDKECPRPGATIRFTPETLDYQSPLPSKKWPKVGQVRQLTYRYLDGICKNDGQDKPCRIEHFSVR